MNDAFKLLRDKIGANARALDNWNTKVTGVEKQLKSWNILSSVNMRNKAASLSQSSAPMISSKFQSNVTPCFANVKADEEPR